MATADDSSERLVTRQFGWLLRLYREGSTDPDNQRRKLSQARLAGLVAAELGLQNGYTAQAVSLWELNKSQIHKDDRDVLVALIKVLHERGGVKSMEEAETLLATGNYRALNEEEKHRIFPAGEGVEEPRPPAVKSQWRLIMLILEELIIRPTEEVRQLAAGAAEGPPPRWPRVLLALLGWPLEHWSAGRTLRAIAWLLVVVATWRLTFGLMAWPFPSPAAAWRAAGLYGAGALLIPLAIGLLSPTRDDPFWRQQSQKSGPDGTPPAVTSRTLRLYTYQGAYVGFHVGYMMVFAAALAGYYLGVRDAPLWLQLAAALWPVALGYAAAQQVPLNLWLAYKKLELRDGAIFFFFVPFGFVGAFFFYVSYPSLQHPVLGPLIVVTAVALAAINSWRQQRRKSGEPAAVQGNA